MLFDDSNACVAYAFATMLIASAIVPMVYRWALRARPGVASVAAFAVLGAVGVLAVWPIVVFLAGILAGDGGDDAS